MSLLRKILGLNQEDLQDEVNETDEDIERILAEEEDIQSIYDSQIRFLISPDGHVDVHIEHMDNSPDIAMRLAHLLYRLNCGDFKVHLMEILTNADSQEELEFTAEILKEWQELDKDDSPYVNPEETLGSK